MSPTYSIPIKSTFTLGHLADAFIQSDQIMSKASKKTLVKDI